MDSDHVRRRGNEDLNRDTEEINASGAGAQPLPCKQASSASSAPVGGSRVVVEPGVPSLI